MSKTDIKTALREFIQTNFMVSEFGDDDSFLDQGIIDSLGVLDVMGFIESNFNVRPAPQDVTPENFDSLNRLTNYVYRNAVVST